MSKRSIIIATLVVLSLNTLASGDILKVMGEPVQITPQGGYFMQPVWSPLGDQLAIAGQNYQGLSIINREGGQPEQISDQMGSGFLPVWDSDGTRIGCRISQVENKRKLSAIAVYDIDKDQATELTKYKKDLGLPRWMDRGRKLFFTSGSGIEIVEAPGAAKSEDIEEDLLLYLRGGDIVLREWPGDEEEVLLPVEENILWAELSPSRDHIALEASGAQLYVVNIDGSDLVTLGRGERPRWSPDGEWITYMITDDDGHRIISSDIYAIKRDGTGQVAITQSSDRLEMNPDWSPDGRMIACDTRGEGAILLIPVEMERSYPPQR